MFFIIILLWERHPVEWEPLCSHLSLREKALENSDMSAEELEIIAAIRSERRATCRKKYREANETKT